MPLAFLGRYDQKMADKHIRDERTLDEKIAAARADKDLQARIADALERNRGALELLAKGDEEQEDR